MRPYTALSISDLPRNCLIQKDVTAIVAITPKWSHLEYM